MPLRPATQRHLSEGGSFSFSPQAYTQYSAKRVGRHRGLGALIFLVVAVFTAAAFLDMSMAEADQPPLQTARVEMIHARDQYPAGGTYPFGLEISIAEGWSIHSVQEEDDGMIPTRLAFDPPAGVTVDHIVFPPSQIMEFENSDDTLNVYSGAITVMARMTIAADHPGGDTALKGQLSYQACSDTLCLPPASLSLNFPMTIGAMGASANRLNEEILADPGIQKNAPAPVSNDDILTGFWLTLAGIFLGGLALNLTPCIYPLIPVTVSYFGSRSENIQRRTVMHAGIYLAGLSLTNSVLGVSAALSGAMLGALLQHPVVLIALAGVMVALALSMFGLWDLNAPGILARVGARNPGGYGGTFFMGLTLGIVAAPCLGPFILGLLTYVGQTGDPVLGFVYFLVLSIGMGLPLCVLASFSGAVKRLPRSGQWMIWVKKAMGWIMVGMAAYLIKPLLPPSWIKGGLIFLIMIAAGIHLGFIDRDDAHPRLFNRIKKALGMVCVLAAVIFWMVAGRPVAGPAWEPYSPEALADAKAASTPVMLDFYADWCLPCKEMDIRTFSDAQVMALALKLKPLRLDLTQRRPDQDEILRRFGIRGVPTVVFIDAHGAERTDLRVTAFVNAQELTVRMRQILKASAR